MDGQEKVLIEEGDGWERDNRSDSEVEKEIVGAVVDDSVKFLVVGSDVNLLD